MRAINPVMGGAWGGRRQNAPMVVSELACFAIQSAQRGTAALDLIVIKSVLMLQLGQIRDCFVARQNTGVILWARLQVHQMVDARKISTLTSASAIRVVDQDTLVNLIVAGKIATDLVAMTGTFAQNQHPMEEERATVRSAGADGEDATTLNALMGKKAGVFFATQNADKGIGRLDAAFALQLVQAVLRTLECRALNHPTLLASVQFPQRALLDTKTIGGSVIQSANLVIMHLDAASAVHTSIARKKVTMGALIYLVLSTFG